MHDSTPRTCKRCGSPFQRWDTYKTSGSHRTHCKPCYLVKASSRQRRGPATVQPSACIYCLGPLVAPASFACSTHRDHHKRAMARIYRHSPTGRAVILKRKRERYAGIGSRARTIIQLAERDGFDCSLCGLRMSIDSVDPLTIDHRVPLARGGSNALANLALAHLSCNKHKAAKNPQGGHPPNGYATTH